MKKKQNDSDRIDKLKPSKRLEELKSELIRIEELKSELIRIEKLNPEEDLATLEAAIRPDTLDWLKELKSKLDRVIEDIVYISNKLGNNYKNQDDIEALNYYELSRDFSERLPDKDYLAASLSNMGIIRYKQGLYLPAIEYFEESRKIRNLTKDYDGMSRSLHYLSICYEAISNHDKSKECAELIQQIGPLRTEHSDDPDEKLREYENVLRERKKYNDLHGIAGVLCDLGNVCGDLEKFSDAWGNYFRSFSMDSVPNVCKAQILNQLGEIALSNEQFKKAKTQFQKSKEISIVFEKKEDTFDQLYVIALHCTLAKQGQERVIRAMITQSNRGLGKSCLGLEMPGLARSYLLENVNRYLKYKDTDGIAESYYLIGLTYWKEGNNDLAQESFELSEKFKNEKIILDYT